MTILILHFFHFGILYVKILTGDCFVLRINRMAYLKLKFGYTGSVQVYSKRLVFVQQSKISHFSFCNPTTSVLVIFSKSVSLIQKP